jgi:polyphosphate kinase
MAAERNAPDAKEAGAGLGEPTASERRDPLAATGPRLQFLDRDHSILAFNERVLDWACRTDVPLLERLRYLCIVSSNLDEFLKSAWPRT